MVLLPEEFRAAKRLAEDDLSDYAIARLTGVPPPTVQRWRHRAEPPGGRYAVETTEWRVRNRAAYCYLLGVYLGDGHLVHRPPNGWTLRVACDQRYPSIVQEIKTAMCATFHGRAAGSFHYSSAVSDVVQISHPAVGRAFPQHGAGRKHLRRIVLASWQLELTYADPAALIRGLIHSDGCRAENRFRTRLPSGRTAEYGYVRYFSSNLSADIRAIFIDHCRLLEVRVAQRSHRNLSVSDRASVAILDQYIGPRR